MSSYNRNSRSGGGRYGGRDFRRSSERREMHRTVCDECGKDCEVPFRPSGDKPVFCSDCFEDKGGGSSKRSSRRSSAGSEVFSKRDNTGKQLLEQANFINTKLDRILKVLEDGIEKKSVSKKHEGKKEVIKVVSKDKIENPEHNRRKLKTKKAGKKKVDKSAAKD